MRFIHYSCEQLTEVKDWTQDGSDEGGIKPDGLWFSVIRDQDGSDSWRDHCKASGKTLQPYRTELLLNKETVLWVQTDAKVDEVAKEYGYLRPPPKIPNPARNYPSTAIRWKRLARNYGGIVVVIGPHCSEYARQESLWYSTWDCASGCVWKANAVRELRPLPQI
jgi:hypothetical protein